MKPHLRKDRGVWVCFGMAPVREMGIWIAFNFFTGHGYTVKEACQDWQEQTRAARNAAHT